MLLSVPLRIQIRRGSVDLIKDSGNGTVHPDKEITRHGGATYISTHALKHSLSNLPVKNMSQSQTRALLSQNAESVRRIIAAVDAIDLDVISSAVNVVNTLGVDVEVDLRVAVDIDVDKVRDGDSLEGITVNVGYCRRCGDGEASEEGSARELHGMFVGWSYWSDGWIRSSEKTFDVYICIRTISTISVNECKDKLSSNSGFSTAEAGAFDIAIQCCIRDLLQGRCTAVFM